MTDMEKFKKMFQALQDDQDEEFIESTPLFESDGEMIWLVDSEILIEFDKDEKFIGIEFPVEA